MLFHYCSLDTLLKILKSRKIWLSDITKMNDPEEYKAGFELVNSQFKNAFPHAADWLNDNHYLSDQTEYLLLACSFSKKGDDLDQWRAYGENGAGVCIGFKKSILERLNDTLIRPEGNLIDGKVRPVMQILPLIYSIHELKEKAKDILLQFKKSDTNKNAFGDDMLFNEYILGAELSELAAAFKKSFYESEREQRMILSLHRGGKLVGVNAFTAHKPVEIDYRLGGYGITAYSNALVSDKSSSAIASITLGPRNTESPTEIKYMLNALGYKNVEVNTSRGHYR
ncbi:hypothetical protein DFO83_102113 [Idiomarina loihiensis]|nr:hypothetical protein DFO83_102113 [Idiomarina loihiensis]TDP49986.1 hypothetical protein DET58_102109 [Idiomarina loihiensis]TDS24662.1 hypothetical protein DET62_102271 [Idiomarina sp. H2]